jgi:hypothetical protein
MTDGGPFLPGLIHLVAAAGVAALLLRVVASVARLGFVAVEATATEGLADMSQRRGDVTGFLERRRRASRLRGSRGAIVLTTVAWTLALILPALMGIGLEAYALCALLWLAPRPRVRPPLAARHTRT